MTERNPIMERIDALTEHWLAFTDQAEARMARWVVATDSTQLVEAFLAYQQEDAGDLRDLFVRFEDPFERPRHYGLVLHEALADQVAALAEDEAEADDPLDAAWRLPPATEGADDCTAFGEALVAFQVYYAELLDHVAVVLTPSRVVDPVAWQGWLLRLLQVPLPPAVRFLVLDRAEAPVLDGLCRMEPARIQTTRIDLDMPGAYAALAAQGDPDDPGVRLRQHIVALNVAASAGDLPSAEQEAQAALAIADREAWAPMQVGVHLALGGAYLGQDRFDKALRSYRAAQQAAEAAPEDDPVAPKLRVQAQMAQGAALFAAARYAEAAPCYEATAPLAEAQGDGVLTLECWRMAATCYETAGQVDNAWDCGLLALDAGAQLDAEAQLHTTLPYVGRLLLRLAEYPAYRGLERRIEGRLADLLGTDWRTRLQQNINDARAA